MFQGINVKNKMRKTTQWKRKQEKGNTGNSTNKQFKI